MLRTVGPQGSLFELLLPAGMRVLSGELAKIDTVLDDERLFALTCFRLRDRDPGSISRHRWVSGRVVAGVGFDGR